MRPFLILNIFAWAMMLALSISVAFAAPVRGPSYIGMCNPNFPCKRALRVFRDHEVKVMGYLADAFGHECQCVKDFLALPGKKYVRVHLANGTCFPERGRRCGKYDVFRGETNRSAQVKLERRDRSLLTRYRASIMRTKALLGPDSDVLTTRYSLCLECLISDKARKVLLKEALKHFPLESIVDSPLRFNCLPGLICEKHGDSMRYAKGQRCISDTDGITLFDANLQRLNRNSKQCEAIFYWTFGFNLLPYEYTGDFILPYKRMEEVKEWELLGVKGCIEP